MDWHWKRLTLNMNLVHFTERLRSILQEWGGEHQHEGTPGRQHQAPEGLTNWTPISESV